MTRFGNWLQRSRKQLSAQKRAGVSGWGYKTGSSAFVEPTVLGGLALLSTSGEGEDRVATHPARQAAQWLAQIQQADGSVGISADLGFPRWGTSYSIWLWCNLHGFEVQAQRAADWIEQQHGQTYPRIPESPIGHDTSIAGWSWVEGTHAWLEPTAAAVLALQRAGRGDSARVAEGLRLIRDRQIATGGWNYGNSEVFQKSLRPLPGPTGMALVALATDQSRQAEFQNALSYLEATLSTVRSAQSLCWGILGLRAWGRCPETVEAWLAEAYEIRQPTGHSSFHLALLILASSTRTLTFLKNR